MVCTLRSQRMAALAGLLVNSQMNADDLGHQKAAAQYMYRELREADEANLIDEKDMHIFDLRPMTDPLHLVCCNACRKPIKASQYVTHAELCSSLNSIEEIGLELDGGTGHKKPPRKDRKKLLAVYSSILRTLSLPQDQITSVGGDKFEILNASDISVPESHLETPPADAKDGPQVLDSIGNGPRNPNCLGSAVPRSRKRSKMTKAEGPLPISDHFEAANGVISQDALPCREHPRKSTTETQKTSSHLNTHQMPRQLDEFYMMNKDVPAPLATKIYYSQRNHRLRSALSHLYYSTSTRGHPSQYLNEKEFPPNLGQTSTPSQNNFSLDQNINDKQDKEVQRCLYSVHKADQIPAQSSEVYSHKSGGFSPTMNVSNQFPVNNVLGSHTSIGKMTSN